MKQLKLNIQSRQETGRGPAYRLRKSGRIPAVLYGQSGSRPISVSNDEFRVLAKKSAGSAALIQLKDEQGGQHLAMIREIERNPITDQFSHIDFHELSKTETFTAHIPVHVVGEEACKGVRLENGLVDQHVYEINVRCTPANMPEQVEVDVTELSVGEGFHLRDLKALKGVDFLGDPEMMLVACTGTTAGRIAAGEEEDPDAETAPAEADGEAEETESAETVEA